MGSVSQEHAHRRSTIMRDRPKAKTIDEYLAGLSDDKREALERLRATIRAAARGAEEYFSYGLPASRLAQPRRTVPSTR
jgi:hypothetical protein